MKSLKTATKMLVLRDEHLFQEAFLRSVLCREIHVETSLIGVTGLPLLKLEQ